MDVPEDPFRKLLKLCARSTTTAALLVGRLQFIRRAARCKLNHPEDVAKLGS